MEDPVQDLELTQEDQLTLMANICERMQLLETVREACEAGLRLVHERLQHNHISICLFKKPVDSLSPFFGLYRVNQVIEEQSRMCCINGAINLTERHVPAITENVETWDLSGLSQGRVNRLSVPIVTHAGKEVGTVIADKVLTEGSWGEFDLQLFRMFTASLSGIISIKQVEFGLQQSSQHMRALIDNLPAYIYVKDTSSRLLLANRKLAFENNIDDPDDMLSKTDFDFYPEDMAQKFFDDEQALIRAGDPLMNIEEAGHNRDGSPSWVLTTKIPLKDDTGNVTCLIGIGLDITDQKQFQLLMVENEKCYRTLFGNILDAILVHDVEGRILDSNDEAHALFRRSHEELVQMSVTDLELPNYELFYKNEIKERAGYQADFKLNELDELCLDIKVSPIDYKGAEAFIVLLRDVTELDDARKRAENAARMKSAFLANMSHEIRTPLNAVIGMTALLADSEMTEEQRDFVQTIQTSGEALLTLINDILDLSKIEAGAFQLEAIPFNLRHCVDGAVDIVAHKAMEKGLEMACCVNGDIPKVFLGDSSRLRQVLLNLLNNAIKFTHKGEVVVRVEGQPNGHDSHELHFSIRDTGIGMTPEVAERVFQPFEQADVSTTRKYGGTGLGLSICNRLVEMMSGSLHVKSEVDVGSEFSFDIILDQVADDEMEAQERVNLETVKGHKVLIVDDNMTNLQIIEYQLKQWSMKPVAFTNGPEVLESIESIGNVDLCILDMLMPEMDGEMLAVKLRETPGFRNTPILILSSTGNATVSSKPFANAWLTKPARPDRLLEKIALLLENKEADQFSRAVVVDPVSPSALGGIHPLKILVAEDNMVNQKVAMKLLSRLGYTADIVENGEEAIEAIGQTEYDVVLMDIQMPVMDGIEATKKLIELYPKEQRPKIVAMTAHALQENRNEALECGMEDYVVKPIRFDDLIRMLKEVPRRTS